MASCSAPRPSWVGLLTHLGVYALYGLLSGATIGRRTSIAGSFAVGLVYGAVIGAVMVALPLTYEVMLERVRSGLGGGLAITSSMEACYFLASPLVKAFAAPREGVQVNRTPASRTVEREDKGPGDAPRREARAPDSARARNRRNFNSWPRVGIVRVSVETSHAPGVCGHPRAPSAQHLDA